MWLLPLGLFAAALGTVSAIVLLPGSNVSAPAPSSSSDCVRTDDCLVQTADTASPIPVPTPSPISLYHADAPSSWSYPPPEITEGASVLIAEESCGAILYEVNSSILAAPSSLTKMMTALVAIEESSLASEITVYIDGIALFFETGSTIMGIEPGQTFTLEDLLYGLLLPSGNDAAIAIAEYIGGDVSSFVMLMNRKALQMELMDTQFATPDGRDAEGQYTSAFDMTLLGRYLLRQPDLASMVVTQTYQPAWDGPPLSNTNPFLYDYPGAIGIKVGFTPEAKDAGVIAAERDGRILIATVLHSDDLHGDVSALLDWAFDATPPQCPDTTINPNT